VTVFEMIYSVFSHLLKQSFQGHLLLVGMIKKSGLRVRFNIMQIIMLLFDSVYNMAECTHSMQCVM